MVFFPGKARKIKGFPSTYNIWFPVLFFPPNLVIGRIYFFQKFYFKEELLHSFLIPCSTKALAGPDSHISPAAPL